MASVGYEHPAAMTVACPRCGKGPRERCIDGWGKQTTPHAVRRRLGLAEAGVAR